MRRRIAAGLMASGLLALAGGVNAPRAMADDPPVTAVGGGAFGIAASTPTPGLTDTGTAGINPTPNVTLPPDGTPRDPNGNLQSYGGSYASLYFVVGQANELNVQTEGSLDGNPYAASFAWVKGIEFYDSSSPRYSAVKAHCAWDNSADAPVFATTYLFLGDDSSEPIQPAPNTIVPLDGGDGSLARMVLNEQHVESYQGRQVIYVDGIHLYLPTLDLIIAEASCDPLRPPVLGATDVRTMSCSLGCFVDPYNNVLTYEVCGDNVDNNGDGTIDEPDTVCLCVNNPDACAPPECNEDGVDHLQSTPAEGVGSRVIHESVEPLFGAAGETIHAYNCNWVVPVEDFIDAELGG